MIIVKSLCGLEASFVPTDEILSVAESYDSGDEMDSKYFTTDEYFMTDRKKKSKRHKGKICCFNCYFNIISF